MAFSLSYGQRPPRPYLVNRYHGDYNRNFQWQQNSRPRMHYNAVDQFSRKPYETSEEHWCETCDRGFHTADMLEKHKQQHEKCNIDGCQFVAHPKVITKHIQMQHSSGLYKKIANLNNPDDIKKWIEERKKKYPTINNIEKKAAATKEKIERGEKMGLCKNKHNRNFKTVSIVETERKLKPFEGIQDLDMPSEINDDDAEESDGNFSIDDDVENFNRIDNTLNNEPVVCNALSSLMCNYESSDEEEKSNEIKETSETQNNTKAQEIMKCVNNVEVQLQVQNSITSEPTDIKINDDNNSDCDSGPEEVKIEKSLDIETVSKEIQSDSSKKQLTKKTIGREVKHKSYTTMKSKLPSTLLQKLLHKEVQHERNVILQCIRYVIKNNYFDK
ncbi:nuclear FMR1 interacting protein 1 [Aphomia sociella]